MHERRRALELLHDVTAEVMKSWEAVLIERIDEREQQGASAAEIEALAQQMDGVARERRALRTDDRHKLEAAKRRYGVLVRAAQGRTQPP